MPPLQRRKATLLAALAAAFLSAIPVVPAFAAGIAGAAPKPAPAAAIRYDAATPLRASVTPLFDTAKPPAGGARLYRVRYDGAGGASIPGLLTVPAARPASGGAPCIVLLHGLGGSKADVLPLAAGLARRGYASLAIDIAGHGERPKIHGKNLAELSIAEMHDLLAGTVVDLRRGVDLLQTRPEIDRSRIGFLGISLGGILGGVVAGEEPRLKAVALWAAGGQWGDLLTTSKLPFAATFRKVNHIRGPEDAAPLEGALADVDPVGCIARVAPRPLLFLNGTDDDTVPRACADALYNAAGQPKQRVLLPGGHIPDPSAMLLQSIAFFDARLKPAGG